MCAGTFGLVSPASCSGEGNVLVRTGVFCHIGMDVLKLWSEREWGKKSKRQTDGQRERGWEREREREGVEGREERHCRREDGMNKQSCLFYSWRLHLAQITCMLPSFLPRLSPCRSNLSFLFLFTYFLLCLTVPPPVRALPAQLPLPSFVVTLGSSPGLRPLPFLPAPLPAFSQMSSHVSQWPTEPPLPFLITPIPMHARKHMPTHMHTCTPTNSHTNTDTVREKT